MRTPFTGVGTALIARRHTRRARSTRAGSKRWRSGEIRHRRAFPRAVRSQTGETPTLSAVERRRVVELVVRAAGGVPVAAGAGGYDTREVVHAAIEMQKAGATGLLSVTPYYDKPTPEGLYQHFFGCHGATPLPIIFTTCPAGQGATSIRRPAPGWRRIPTVVAVKEASGNIQQMVELCAAVPDDFLVLSSDDA